MKKETRQFWQAMWIMMGKDMVKWLAIIGVFCGVAVGVNACDKNNAVSNNQSKIALTNLLNSKTR